MKRIATKTIGVILAMILVISSIVPVFAAGETEGDTPTVCEHVWSSWTVTTSATYFDKGSKTRTCDLCGTTETVTIKKKTGNNNWATKNGKKYYFNSKGKLVKGWNKIKASNKKNATVKWCWFDNKGVFKKAVSKNTRNKWVKVGKKKFYFGPKKKPLGKGFHIIRNKLYYLGSDKAMVKGKFKVGGKTYKTTKAGNITGLPYLIKRYKNFVLIDISSQQLSLYLKGKRIMKTSVVTGTPGDRATPTGIFSVRNKARNVRLTGATWDVPVSYWMPFIGAAYGMHDASWRYEREFTNHRTYLTNGSHGCVNMRYRDAKKLYSKVRIGMTVVVQR